MVSKPSSEVAAALKRLPTSVRAALRAQCDGEWARVTVQVDGSFKVHNSVPAMDAYAARLAAMSSPAPPPAPAPPAPAPPPVVKATPAPPPPRRKLRTVVDPTALLELVRPSREVEPVKQAQGGVSVVRQPPRPREDSTVYSDFDLEASRTYPVDELLSKSANHLRELFKSGLPRAIRYSHLPEVLALYGVDQDMMDAALRHPERVDLRPESFDKDKRYPVLGFRRGDLLVILGLRTPATPKVIAAYASSLLMHDTHRVGHTGGGGARAKAGLPTTPKAAARTLRMLGAQVAVDEMSGKPAPVTYKGQDLGSIRTDERTTKADVESDFQRCVRRMHAIDRREGVSA